MGPLQSFDHAACLVVFSFAGLMFREKFNVQVSTYGWHLELALAKIPQELLSKLYSNSRLNLL